MTGFMKILVAVIMLSLLAILVTSKENYEMPFSLESRIFGGKYAKEGQFPYFVRIIAQVGPTSEIKLSYCGGSIIGPKWVLTAGHCYVPKNDTLGFITYHIEAGSIVSGEPRQFDIVPNEHAFLHPNFDDRPALKNDLTLLKTKRWTFDEYVSPIKIASSSWSAESYVGETITAMGYGLFSDNDTLSEELRWTDLEVITRRKCNPHYKKLADSAFCAVDKENNPNEQSVCPGDSGGPVVIKEDGKLFQIGLVSFGPEEECLDGPTAYTNIAMFHDWIYQTMAQNSYLNRKINFKCTDSGIYIHIPKHIVYPKL